MKSSCSNDQDLLGDNDEILELEMLLPDQSDHAHEHTRPIHTRRFEVLFGMLRAVFSGTFHSPRTNAYHKPVTHRASTYTRLPLRVHFSIPRYLRLRPRTLIFFTLTIILWTPILLLALVLAYGGVPPDYSAVRRWERELPQHVWRSSEVKRSRGRVGRRGGEINVDDGRRYLRFPDHLWGHGLNNVLQEALLTSHLAHRAQRSFVFEDFTWSHLPLPYTIYDFTLRPTRVPLSAFVGGWVVGGGISGTHNVVEEHVSGVLGSMPISRSDASDAVNRVDGLPGSTFSVELASTSTTPATIPRSARAAIEERRAVSAEYFEYVCPPSRRVEIRYRQDSFSSRLDASDVTSRNSYTTSPPGNEASGTEIVEWWIRRLQQPDVREEPCVVVREEERRVFDSNFFGSTRILPLFDELKGSPILRGFTWSPLVHHALERTMSRFFGQNNTSTLTSTPELEIAPKFSSHPSKVSVLNLEPIPILPSSQHFRPTISGLLAVHLRRGDYKRHCLRLAEWRAGYMGFNRFDGMLDTFDVEEYLRNTSTSSMEPHPDKSRVDDDEGSRRGLIIERREAYYLAHCLPTIQDIVQRLHNVREEYQKTLYAQHSAPSSVEHALRDVYVLTNGWPSFVEELRAELLADGWQRVMGTPQLEDATVFDDAHATPTGAGTHQIALAADTHSSEDTIDSPPAVGAGGLTREEKGVSVAVDMGFAERAEVFVGNGFSSLSSNIVMLRMARGMPIYSSRLL